MAPSDMYAALINSNFIKLPHELRNEVYKFTLDGSSSPDIRYTCRALYHETERIFYNVSTLRITTRNLDWDHHRLEQLLDHRNAIDKIQNLTIELCMESTLRSGNEKKPIITRPLNDKIDFIRLFQGQGVRRQLCKINAQYLGCLERPCQRVIASLGMLTDFQVVILSAAFNFCYHSLHEDMFRRNALRLGDSLVPTLGPAIKEERYGAEKGIVEPYFSRKSVVFTFYPRRYWAVDSKG